MRGHKQVADQLEIYTMTTCRSLSQSLVNKDYIVPVNQPSHTTSNSLMSGQGGGGGLRVNSTISAPLLTETTQTTLQMADKH